MKQRNETKRYFSPSLNRDVDMPDNVKNLEVKNEEIDLPYHVVSTFKLDELIVMTNQYMTVKKYKPIGGAFFSDELGIWTQTLTK